MEQPPNTAAPASGLSDSNVGLVEPWVECREAFVKTIKEENFYRYSCKWSLKQNWSGPKAGFADTQLQRRWLDFKLGWEAALAQN